MDAYLSAGRALLTCAERGGGRHLFASSPDSRRNTFHPGEANDKKAPRPEGREAKYPNVKSIDSYIISDRTQGLILLPGQIIFPAREKSHNAMDSLTLEIRKNSPASSPWKNRQTGYPGTDAAHHSMYSPSPCFQTSSPSPESGINPRHSWGPANFRRGDFCRPGFQSPVRESGLFMPWPREAKMDPSESRFSS